MKSEPENQTDQYSLYMMAAGVAGQVGCLVGMTAIGAVVLGLFLDNALGTKPLFIFVLLLGSIPLTIFMIFRYTKRKTRNLQASAPQKEDDISA